MDKKQEREELLLKEDNLLSFSKKIGLKEEEFKKISSSLGRLPSYEELLVFSGLWNEHCGYKHSKFFLKRFPSVSRENAGVVFFNKDWALVFKIESHNHPSAVEPFHGASTGVGGIFRDVFSMGARVFLTLNSLRFAPPVDRRTKYLLKEVVRGIAFYGNSVGVACAGGEIYFDKGYYKNPLVNAMAVGVVRREDLVSSFPPRKKLLLVYAGAETGRDGIHGASFASRELQEEEDKGSIQIGDPFLEKLLMEATLELVEKKLITSCQDMGAAGLLSASVEMAEKGKMGVKIYVDKIPAREEKMDAWEFLLSESQERMLYMIEEKDKEEVLSILRKWRIRGEIIGETLLDREYLEVYQNGSLKIKLPISLLTNPPIYVRSSKVPPRKKEDPQVLFSLKKSFSLEESIYRILSSFNGCSRFPLFSQYDSEVGGGAYLPIGNNAGVYRIPEKEDALVVVSVDGNNFYTALEPYLGVLHSFAEAYRNILSQGGKPLGATNGINLGNPEKEEGFYVLKEVTQALLDASLALEVPITGGNVSLYNETQEGSIPPTVMIGMVGILSNEKEVISPYIEEEKEVYLVGFFRPSLSASLFKEVMGEERALPLPYIDLEEEKKMALFIEEAKPYILSCKDVSIGGVFLSLWKMLVKNPPWGARKGFLWEKGIEKDLETLFGESASSYLMVFSSKEKVFPILKKYQIPYQKVGEVISEKKMVFSSKEFFMEDLYKRYMKPLSFLSGGEF